MYRPRESGKNANRDQQGMARMNAKETWGNHLVAIRKRYNLSQEELADQIGTNQATISRWERCLSSPTYRLQKAITSLYGAPSEPSVDRATIAGAAQSLINQIHGYGGVIFDRNEICIAASANVQHQAGKSIRDTTPAWEHAFFDQWSEFMAEVDFWNTPWATFEYIHKTQPRLDEPPRWMRSMFTSIVICGEVYCLVHSKTDQMDYVEVLPDNP